MKTTASDTATRGEIDADLWQLTQKWEGRGMPLLGSMLRIIGWAYRQRLEGGLETMMDTWLWSNQKLNALREMANGRPIPAHDPRARTEETARRHQRKYEAMGGEAARKKTHAKKITPTRRRP